MNYYEKQLKKIINVYIDLKLYITNKGNIIIVNYSNAFRIFSYIIIMMYVVCSDFQDHPASLRPLVAKVSSRTASHVSSSQQPPPQTLPKPFTQQPPPTQPKPQVFIQPAQPPPTYVKPSIKAPQTQPKPQGFVQPLPKPFTPAGSQPKAQVPPQTPPKPQSFPQPLVKSQSLPLDHGEDFSRHSVQSGDLLSPTESGDGLSYSMSSKQMSIKER